MAADPARPLFRVNRFQFFQPLIGSACLLFGLVNRNLSFPILILICPLPIGLCFLFALVRAAVQFRLVNPCLDSTPHETEYRPDWSSVIQISDLVFLGVALNLLFLLLHGSVLSLFAGCFQSIFIGIVPGLLAVVFHLIGLTRAHGPDGHGL